MFRHMFIFCLVDFFGGGEGDVFVVFFFFFVFFFKDLLTALHTIDLQVLLGVAVTLVRSDRMLLQFLYPFPSERSQSVVLLIALLSCTFLGLFTIALTSFPSFDMASGLSVFLFCNHSFDMCM